MIFSESGGCLIQERCILTILLQVYVLITAFNRKKKRNMFTILYLLLSKAGHESIGKKNYWKRCSEGLLE